MILVIIVIYLQLHNVLPSRPHSQGRRHETRSLRLRSKYKTLRRTNRRSLYRLVEEGGRVRDLRREQGLTISIVWMLPVLSLHTPVKNPFGGVTRGKKGRSMKETGRPWIGVFLT